mmetsp:Transcript_63009/g.163511  ORF Transcript_63009/g.163511 Transcript_63009/m.163511 type:complete len:223 (-) Transcript_63009:380-1048(-)
MPGELGLEAGDELRVVLRALLLNGLDLAPGLLVGEVEVLLYFADLRQLGLQTADQLRQGIVPLKHLDAGLFHLLVVTLVLPLHLVDLVHCVTEGLRESPVRGVRGLLGLFKLARDLLDALEKVGTLLPDEVVLLLQGHDHLLVQLRRALSDLPQNALRGILKRLARRRVAAADLLEHGREVDADRALLDVVDLPIDDPQHRDAPRVGDRGQHLRAEGLRGLL